MKPPKVTSSRVVYENRWLRLREDRLERADGSPGIYSVVEKPPAALVVPEHSDRSLTLVEQYRHPIGARRWEFPQGSLDGAGEVPAEETARTELAEETGLRATSLEHVGRLHFAYGISNQCFDVWLARGLTQGDQALEAEEEGLVVARFTRGEVEDMIRNGAMTDAASVAALALDGLRGEP